ncbi:polysaccharide pyruvyl transferase family protein [Clostridium tertium]|uniref:polysaccharide pyruvyl transferase family protein n=1 Tax=Clostridium tertium TaxID=1559 RepID=UPI0024B331BF|nr:polysaccharide pyruvyl transferase family protein [Clostridium tertium]MDI9217005.1 polysaccharide pyruvyl transferase family protein [Clostridium tertium]
MNKSINVVGAFDRYNYGDVLFPIIIEEYLKRYRNEVLKDYDIQYYGLVESDLSQVGGKRTKALKEIYNGSLEKDSMIIVAGGDVLPARISSMDVDLSSNILNMLFKKVLIKVLGRKNFEVISMKRFGINSRFPWVINKENFTKNINITYNAVGGSTLNRLESKEVMDIKEKLSDSQYISVRDDKSLANIKEINPSMFPDSATLMSDFFPVEFLENVISEEVKNAVKMCEGGYICIQSNLCSIRGKEKRLVDQIEKICLEKGLKVVLLPIGIAANHDDNIALRKLKKYFSMDVIHIEDLNIYDIMYFIAKSDFFAGTSLHGNITSMSYAIHHIGLNKGITKLDEYLNTWDIKEQNHCIDFNDLYEEYNKVKEISKEELLNKRQELLNLSLENFNKLFRCLEENSNE